MFENNGVLRKDLVLVRRIPANHVQWIKQNQPDPNGGGASRRPALPGLGVYIRSVQCPLLYVGTRA